MFHHTTHTYTHSHAFTDSHWETGSLPPPFESRWVFDSFEINKMCQNDAIIMVSEKAIYYISYSLEHFLVEPWVAFVSLSTLQLPCMVSKPGYMEECWISVIDRLSLSLRTHDIHWPTCKWRYFQIRLFPSHSRLADWILVEVSDIRKPRKIIPTKPGPKSWSQIQGTWLNICFKPLSYIYIVVVQ